MNRIKENKKMVANWINEWSLACMHLFQDWKDNCIGCKVVFNGEVGYEIGEGRDKHTVFLDKYLCTCRAWELTGIPCSHAICALYHSQIDPMSVLSKWYHKTTYLATYQQPLLPVPGPRFYRMTEFQPIEPLPLPKFPGIPKNERVRASNEKNSSGQREGKLSKKGLKQVCGLC